MDELLPESFLSAPSLEESTTLKRCCNFPGPCIGLDTACSSSLVATHLAHRGLLNGETNAALAAGVNMMLVASTTTNLAALGALSSNGRSKTFEATADGYGRGEGCVVVAMRLAGSDEKDCHAILQGEILS